MFEEIGEVEVEEEDEDEGDGGDEDYEDDRVLQAAFELDGGGVGGVLDVDEVGGGADLGVGGDGEGVGEEDDEEHADGNGSHHADYLDSEGIEDAT